MQQPHRRAIADWDPEGTAAYLPARATIKRSELEPNRRGGGSASAGRSSYKRWRRDESRRGTQECVRHVILALMGFTPREALASLRSGGAEAPRGLKPTFQLVLDATKRIEDLDAEDDLAVLKIFSVESFGARPRGEQFLKYLRAGGPLKSSIP